MKTLTDNEAKVVGKMFELISSWEREDVTGVLMKFGFFRELPDDQLVSLASKLEEFCKIETR